MVTACGYSVSSSPYGLLEPLSVAIPVAKNSSRYAELGPQLTTDLIRRLDASSNITVREGAPATLTLNISRVYISGGSWESLNAEGLPTSSASRVAVVQVQASLERPSATAGGQPKVRRQGFSSQRNFLVGTSQTQSEQNQREAFNWIIEDLSQKIGQNMFSEF